MAAGSDVINHWVPLAGVQASAWTTLQGIWGRRSQGDKHLNTEETNRIVQVRVFGNSHLASNCAFMCLSSSHLLSLKWKLEIRSNNTPDCKRAAVSSQCSLESTDSWKIPERKHSRKLLWVTQQMENISGFSCTKKRSLEYKGVIFTLLFFKVKPHLKIRFIALHSRTFPISNFRETSPPHPTEKSFWITCSILSLTSLLHCSALQVSHVWFYLFIDLEIIRVTLNEQETQIKEKWQRGAYKKRSQGLLCYFKGPQKADIKMVWVGFRFTLSHPGFEWLNLNTLRSILLILRPPTSLP